MNTHTQCVLKRTDGSTQVSWIPSGFAQEGRYVKLKEGGEWKNGWEVFKAFPDSPLPSETVQERERDFKNHRKATDV